MSYRDDLSQAHERIAQLERELHEERAKKAAPPEAPRQPFALVIVASVAIGLLLIVGIVFVMRRRAAPEPIPVKPSSEVAREQPLVPGTTTNRALPCEGSSAPIEPRTAGGEP